MIMAKLRRINDKREKYMSDTERKELEQLREMYRKNKSGEPLTLEELNITRKMMRKYEQFVQAGKYGKAFIIFLGALAGVLVSGREIFRFFGEMMEWLKNSNLK